MERTADGMTNRKETRGGVRGVQLGPIGAKGGGDKQVERKSGTRTECEGKKGDGVVKVRGKRSERVPRATAPKGAVLRVGWQPGVPDRRGARSLARGV